MLCAVRHHQRRPLAIRPSICRGGPVAWPSLAHAVVAAAVHPFIGVCVGALEGVGPVAPPAVHGVSRHRAGQLVLLPVNNTGVLVRSSHAFFFVPIPATVRVHGIETLLLCGEPGTSLNRQTNDFLIRGNVEGIGVAQHLHFPDGDLPIFGKWMEDFYQTGLLCFGIVGQFFY